MIDVMGKELKLGDYVEVLSERQLGKIIKLGKPSNSLVVLSDNILEVEYHVSNIGKDWGILTVYKDRKSVV